MMPRPKLVGLVLCFLPWLLYYHFSPARYGFAANPVDYQATGEGSDKLVPKPVETNQPTTQPVKTSQPTTQPVKTSQPTTQPVKTSQPTTQPVKTNQPTAKPVKTNQPTAIVYPVWDIPQPNRSVVSSFKDFQWTYPTITNQTEYANKRYVKNEFATCVNRRHLCCAVGGTASGGGQVSNGCGFRMDYMAEFEPIPKRPLFSLVDMLLAWRLQHPNATSFQMLFIGDSVTGQVFTAAVCELARNSKVKSFTFDSPAEVPVNFTSFRTSLSFQESHVTLLGHEDFDFTLLFIRQFQLTSNAKAVSLFLGKADVILFGWGLHYMLIKRAFPSALARLFEELKRHSKPRTLLWFGAPKQHFRYSLNDTQVDGSYQPRRKPITFCGPVARFPIAQSHSINDFAFDYVTNHLHINASWFKWKEGSPVNDTMHVHFFPFEELTSPFFRNHASYNANASLRANDCTHSCGAPNLYEPFWDALYLLTATNKPPQKRFPSGTQHRPQLIKPSIALAYVPMIQELKDKVLT
ncbi:hypothetical protein BASA81_008269 [Batrachochytrium salamandrivorans]|nr:hypothetical protein BASA81_008269 [Batrachochytrium salamandrivorans]